MYIMKLTHSEINIRTTIKDLLKKHGHTYNDLARALDLSEGAVKQLMTKGTFTTSRLEIVASWFGLSLLEFMEIALKAESKPHKLSLAQEELLLSEPVSIWMLFLLGSGFSLETTRTRMNIEKTKFQKALHVLDRCGLIELLPNDRIRLNSRAPYRFDKMGAIEKRLRKEYLELVTHQIGINPPSDTLQRTFEMYVSTKLFDQFKKDILQLLQRYAHLARIETETDWKDRTIPITGLFFIKPFDGWGTLLRTKQRQP